MRVLILKTEDGSTRQFDFSDGLNRLIDAIQNSDVEAIIVGDVHGGTVLWEKQFNACTAMPTDFGKGK